VKSEELGAQADLSPLWLSSACVPNYSLFTINDSLITLPAFIPPKHHQIFRPTNILKILIIIFFGNSS
jgi:hypothetical protein